MESLPEASVIVGAPPHPPGFGEFLSGGDAARTRGVGTSTHRLQRYTLASLVVQG